MDVPIPIEEAMMSPLALISADAVIWPSNCIPVAPPTILKSAVLGSILSVKVLGLIIYHLHLYYLMLL